MLQINENWTNRISQNVAEKNPTKTTFLKKK